MNRRGLRPESEIGACRRGSDFVQPIVEEPYIHLLTSPYVIVFEMVLERAWDMWMTERVD